MSPFGEGETWLNKSSQRPPHKHVGLNWDSFEDRHKDARLVMMWNNKRKCSSFWKRLKTITQNLPIVFHCPSLYHSTRNKLKELQSLLGKLNFVSQCIHPGRIFVNRLLNWLREIPEKVQISIPDDFKLETFPPRTISDWNRLSQHIVMSRSLVLYPTGIGCHSTWLWVAPSYYIWLEPVATAHSYESLGWNIQSCCLFY